LTAELYSLYARGTVLRHPLRRGDLRAIGVALAVLIASACSDPASPTHVVASTPSLLCPAAPATTTVTNGQSAVVVYGAASETGGTAPVSVSCVPASGSSFPMGTTNVTCTATDAARRSASCAFTVSVVNSPTLRKTRILAFGDSVTEGEVPVYGEFGTTSIRPYFVELPKSYPADLVTLLANRYTAQGATRIDALMVRADNSTDCGTNPSISTTSQIVVINAGCLGERATDPATTDRLTNKLSFYKPDLVLLLEGVNDINNSTSIDAAVGGVVNLIGVIRNQSKVTPVMVGTLLPEIPGLRNAGNAALIPQFNSALIPRATAAGAQVVDLYGDIALNLNGWISPYDGLHPTEDGYGEIASVWFKAIQQQYENTGNVTTTTTSAIRRR